MGTTFRCVNRCPHYTSSYCVCVCHTVGVGFIAYTYHESVKRKQLRLLLYAHVWHTTQYLYFALMEIV